MKNKSPNLWKCLKYQGIKNKEIKIKENSELITSIHHTKKTRIYGKKYHVITPEGIELCCIGLLEIQRLFKLEPRNMYDTIRGIKPNYHGYQIKLIDNSFDRHVKAI